MPEIHPTAIVSPGASLSEGVSVGPYSVLGPQVVIGSGTVIQHHASVVGRTVIGAGNRIFPFASIGAIPQDLKYRGEDTSLVIGDNNTFRESTTVHIGTEGGGGVTRIGNGNLFMAYSHVAHDCIVGNGVVMANCAGLAGHIEVHDHAIIGGLTGVHQFVRVGKHSMVGGGSAVFMDIPPYTTASGNRARLFGLNLVGLKRHGFTDEQVGNLKKAYRIIFRSNLILKEALEKVEQEIPGSPEVTYLVEFIRSSSRGITRGGQDG